MRHAAAGFTLIEMLATVSVLAVMTVIGAGSYQSIVASTRMSSEINALLRNVNFARSEAIKRGLSVSVCPQSGSGCDSITNWTSGWLVLDAAATQLLISPGVTHGDTLTSSLTTYPTFNGAGYTFFNGTITLHDRNNTPSLYRCIVFNAGSWTTKKGAVCP